MLVVSAVDKTQGEAVQRGRQQLLKSVSVAVCHCHHDLQDAVDVNVLNY